jgi:Resolvase, N terminal domain
MTGRHDIDGQHGRPLFDMRARASGIGAGRRWSGGNRPARGSGPVAIKVQQHERHRFSAVVVPKLSRFGPSMSELVRLFDLFDNDDISLIFLDLKIDTGTSQGRLCHVMAAFAEYESDVNSDYAREAVGRSRPGRIGSPLGTGL